MKYFYSIPQKLVIAGLILLVWVISAYAILISPGYYSQPELFLKQDDFFLIDINNASVDELCLLPGISSNIAYQIIEYRRKAGRINNIDELSASKGIRGIGRQKLKQIERHTRKIIPEQPR